MSFDVIDILENNTGEWNDDLVGGPSVFVSVFHRCFENETIAREVLRHVDVLFELLEFIQLNLFPLAFSRIESVARKIRSIDDLPFSSIVVLVACLDHLNRERETDIGVTDSTT